MDQPLGVDRTELPAQPPSRDSATTQPLISAKLTVPALAPAHRTRRRLLTMLDDAGRYRLTAVTGPAGSGKTTLMASWVASAAGPVAWLTLDGEDNTPAVFWTYLRQAIGGGPGTVAEPDRPGDHAAVARLAAEVAARRAPLTVVLDNADAVVNPAVGTELDLLLRYTGAALRLVLVGRSARLVPLHRYQLTAELAEVDADRLALTVEEIVDVAGAYGVPLSPAAAQTLHRRTEGWVTGACLHALAMRPGATDTAGDAADRAVADLLRTEILDAQPARTQDLLLRTSIVREPHPDLADRLTGRSDTRAVLNELVRSNAFVCTLPDGRYRYYEPFRRMLLDEAAGRHPDLLPRLHHEAARWYEQHGRYLEALHHAVTAGAWGLAAEVAVNRLGVAWLSTSPAAGRYRSVLAGLPADEDAPAAQVLRPSLALADHDLAAARTAARTAAAALHRFEDRPGPLRLGMRAAEIVLSRYAGDADAAAGIAAEIDALVGQLGQPGVTGEASLRALSQTNLGVAALWAGRLADARQALSRAAATPVAGTEYVRHDALAHLALLACHEGRLDRAEAQARESLLVAERSGVRPETRVGAADLALAGVALLRHDLAAVREHLSRARLTNGARLDPPTATGIAMVRARMTTPRSDGRALAMLDEVRANLDSWHPSRAVADAVALAAVRAHLALGDTGTARRCLAPVSDGAARVLASILVLAADGDRAGVRSACADLHRRTARPDLLQEAALAAGKIAHAGGDGAQAARAVHLALEYGEPELRRWLFVETGPWLHDVLRARPELRAAAGWLALPAGGGSPVTAPVPRSPAAEQLTGRELEVLCRLAEALSTEDIADALYLSVNTVKTHLKSIYRKLGASGRSAAARRARELRLLPTIEGNAAR